MTDLNQPQSLEKYLRTKLSLKDRTIAQFKAFHLKFRKTASVKVYEEIYNGDGTTSLGKLLVIGFTNDIPFTRTGLTIVERQFSNYNFDFIYFNY